MSTTESILAEYTSTRSCPALAREYGVKNASITVTAKAYQLAGNSHPHFSVTAEIYKPGKKNDPFAGGCLHEEVLKYFPKLAPIVRLHLSNADDGEPMHAVASGFYYLAGAVPNHFGERYFFEKSPEECLQVLANHLRISLAKARDLRYSLLALGNEAAKQAFSDYCDTLRAQWKQEAEDGIALLKSLSTISEQE